MEIQAFVKKGAIMVLCFQTTNIHKTASPLSGHQDDGLHEGNTRTRCIQDIHSFLTSIPFLASFTDEDFWKIVGLELGTYTGTYTGFFPEGGKILKYTGILSYLGY